MSRPFIPYMPSSANHSNTPSFTHISPQPIEIRSPGDVPSYSSMELISPGNENIPEESSLPPMSIYTLSYFSNHKSVNRPPSNKLDRIPSQDDKMLISLELDRRVSSMSPAFMKTNSKSDINIESNPSSSLSIMNLQAQPSFQFQNSADPQIPAAEYAPTPKLVGPIFSNEDIQKVEEEEKSVVNNKEAIQEPSIKQDESIATPCSPDKSRKKAGRKSNFTPENDMKILELVKIYGENNWSVIASHMPKFNRKQLREHYVNYLKEKTVSLEFTEEEDRKIIQLVKEKGKKWQIIAKEFIGRTALAIKNRYRTRLRPKKGSKSVEDSKEVFSEKVSCYESTPEESSIDDLEMLSRQIQLPGGAKRGWDGFIMYSENQEKPVIPGKGTAFEVIKKNVDREKCVLSAVETATRKLRNISKNI